MIYFVGHVSSRIKEWKELMRQSDGYLKEGKQITERVDAILDEIDTKKNDLLDFYGKLKDDSEDEISRYADALQQKSDHRLREEVMDLRQKAEKELGATLGEMKTQLEHEVRRQMENQRKKFDSESGEAQKKFLQDVEAHRLLMEGVFYATHRRFDEAIKTYRRLLAVRPDHAPAWVRLGDVHRELAQFDAAEEAYRKALESAPQDPRACYSLAALFAKRKNRDRMLEFLTRAVANDGEFKDEALNDEAFRDFWNDPAFKDLAEA
jgi:tetratricopeptide (TPR) repeat protein